MFDIAALYVSVGTIEKYKGAEGWKDFARIKEKTPKGIAELDATSEQIHAEDGQLYDLQGCRIVESMPLQPSIYMKDERKLW